MVDYKIYMEELRRKNYIFKEKENIQALFLVWSLYFLKKSCIITPEILDSFWVTNTAGSWIIFLLYSFLLGGKL